MATNSHCFSQLNPIANEVTLTFLSSHKILIRYIAWNSDKTLFRHFYPLYFDTFTRFFSRICKSSANTERSTGSEYEKIQIKSFLHSITTRKKWHFFIFTVNPGWALEIHEKIMKILRSIRQPFNLWCVHKRAIKIKQQQKCVCQGVGDGMRRVEREIDRARNWWINK